MKTYALVAFILILVGIGAFVCQGISYTTGEKAVDFGVIHTKTTAIPLLPLAGALALLGGISLLAIGDRKTDGLQYLSNPKRSRLLHK